MRLVLRPLGVDLALGIERMTVGRARQANVLSFQCDASTVSCAEHPTSTRVKNLKTLTSYQRQASILIT